MEHHKNHGNVIVVIEIVHRLDRDTSGALIAAKDPMTKRALQKQFQEWLPAANLGQSSHQ